MTGDTSPWRMLREDGDFRRYFTSRIVSLAGSVATFVCLPVLVYRLSHSPLLTAVVTTLEALPYLLVGLLAGALTDRWDRQRVMVTCDLLCAASVGSIPLAAAFDVLTVPHLLVAAFASQAFFTFFDGANFGALPTLVGRNRVASANAAVWSIASAVESVGPALVGLALAAVGPANLLVVDALSFLASAYAIRGIRRALHDRTRARTRTTGRALAADVREGLAFLVHHAGVRTMTVVGALQSAATGGAVALLVVWSDRVLHIGSSGLRFGSLYAAWGIGGFLAALILPRMLRRATATRILLLSVPASAVLALATSRATTWQAADAGLLCWGAAATLVAVNSISYRQEVTPEPLLGRVNTVARMLAWGLGYTCGSLLAGALSEAVGVRAAMTTMACAGVVATVVAWTSPLRREVAPTLAA